MHRRTTLFTLISSMVGTALITSAFMLYASLQASLQEYETTHIGKIESDVTTQTGKVSEQDWKEVQSKLEKGSALPVVTFYGNLTRGKENIVPHIVFHAFSYQEALKWDVKAVQSIPSPIEPGEIVLSKRAAAQLGVQEGAQVQLVIPPNTVQVFTVKKIVPEHGLTGYRGTKQGKATAFLSLETARKIMGLKEGYTNLLLASFVASDLFPAEKWEIHQVKNDVLHAVNNIQKFVHLFFITSLVAIVIGIVLVFNIFKMIGEERRKELGVIRAIGMNTGDLSRVLRIEGIVYASVSSLLGMVLGIGLSILALQQLQSLIQLMSQYRDEIEISYQFTVDPYFLFTAGGIGFCLVYFSMMWISWRASKQNIVSMLQITKSPMNYSALAKRRMKWKKVFYTVLALFTLALIMITLTPTCQNWLTKRFPDQENYFYAGAVLFVFVSSLWCLQFIFPTLLSSILKGLQGHSKWVATLQIAFRYPIAYQKRTILILFMFMIVLFLTAFASMIGSAFASWTDRMEARQALGGYDLAAQSERQLSTKALQDIVNKSKYIEKNQISGVTSVIQANVSLTYPDFKVNGIDQSFAEHNQVVLEQKETRFKSDQAVWQEVAQDPEVVVISSRDLGLIERDQRKKYQIGEQVPIQVEGKVVSKKLIAIAKYYSESYGYFISYGIWMNQNEVERLAEKTENVWLFRVHDKEQLRTIAKKVQKEVTEQGAFQLLNPEQQLVVSQSFIRVIFSLLESFSFLATVIGLAGLMVIMFRQVQERQQQLGMIRALGIEKKQVYWSIFSEGFIIAFLGIVLGIGMGVYAGSLILKPFGQTEQIEQYRQAFPLFKILLYFVLGLVISIFGAFLPARKALKVSPIEATRYIS
ncbi:ABC transporter permease [Thermoflavimicrobium dichotomicum]|nr:FtsX-like permease family protein [Thermoflavimicrobium dichotomicum]